MQLKIFLWLFSAAGFPAAPLRGQALRKVDICVYGATSGGVIAACSAAKAGRTVLLVEPGRHPGGLSSGGLGMTDIGNKTAITGLARNFYQRIGAHYGEAERWTFEPHVAEAVFNDYLAESGVPVIYGVEMRSLKKTGRVIRSLRLDSAGTALTVAAKAFIDCSYEGDLMAMAGVSFTTGREANAAFGETYDGVQLRDKHQFPDGIDPYRTPGDSTSGLVWGVSDQPLAAGGSGDKHVQAYNFRLCLTDSTENKIPLGRPADYDSTKYELLARLMAAEPGRPLSKILNPNDMPGRKTDINNNGPLSTDLIGGSDDYPQAGPAARHRIRERHKSYTLGLLYFIGHDPRMPAAVREEMLRWGLPGDEFTDNDHWTPQLYIREARRMRGEYVMTEANCTGKETVTDGVGLAAYTMDSHNCQRLVVHHNGRAMVKNEGDVQVGGFPPYPVAYRALVPQKKDCSNLLVPVCLSASHIAYGSIRMEPVFMVLGQSAALAAVLAIREGVAVQDIDVAALQQWLKTDPLLTAAPPRSR